jgi:hypothetical protein
LEGVELAALPGLLSVEDQRAGVRLAACINAIESDGIGLAVIRHYYLTGFH